ncbi:hypothetical protein U0035_20315 [Niabella yanshanensis]|uniref:Lipoprotein n=2 Tax=Niabella yanshanensis TaxID=577386 RepID=A0ABZ0W5Q0_9BACT|nr:hypothetical protein [Niabella yanshanensis]WQD38014.1 hypothetical protein U0035_20315 [Niabella yanshanensis]
MFLITAFFFQACGSQKEKSPISTTQDISKDNIPIKTNKEISPGPTTTLPLRHFPVTDSTSFDDFEKSGIPDTGFLKRINFDPRRKDANNFRLNYQLPFSDSFTSVVISYQCGENELFTTLVTINKDNKIIDKLEIAYDEVAESAFGKTSKIEKDKIVVTSSNWMSEPPMFETETYILTNDGKFKKE